MRDAANTTDLLDIDAANPGTWADGMVVRFTPRIIGSVTTFTVSVGTLDGSEFVAQESSRPGTGARHADEHGECRRIAASTLIRLTLPAGGAAALRSRLEAAPPASVTLGSGGNGSAPALDDYQAILTALLKVRDISILLLPGIFWSSAANRAIVNAAIAHCESIRNRMLVVDTEPGNELTSESEVKRARPAHLDLRGELLPPVRIANPFYNADSNPPRRAPCSPRRQPWRPAWGQDRHPTGVGGPGGHRVPGCSARPRWSTWWRTRSRTSSTPPA
ncbi:MAG: hypothetical protein MZW92_65555 [Comamonadaceae bacterium]|nr:hypothetical protein [Comamonadaceae bacterium]